MNRILRESFFQTRYWVALGAVVVSVVVFVVLNRRPNEWRAYAELMIQLPQSANASNTGWSRTANTYAQLSHSQNLLNAVIGTTNTALTPDSLATMINVTLLPDTELLVVDVTASDPSTAQILANATARQIVNTSQQLADNPDADKLHSQIDALNIQIEAAHADWQTIETQIDATPSPNPLALADLRARRTDAIDHYLLLQSNLGMLNSQYLLLTSDIPQITIADMATMAESINTISPLWGGALAAFFGALAGFAFSLWLGNADVALRTPTVISRALDLPTLGVLPLIRVKAGEEKLVHRADITHSEPYRALIVGLGLADSAPGWIVGVTSPAADEGKTLSAANLAVTLAQSGRRTLLIDADLRTPMLHRLFKISNREGLTSMLHEFSLRADLQAAHMPAPNVPDDADTLDDIHSGVKRTDLTNLSLLTSGPLPARPEDVFGSTYLPRLIRALADQYDVVVVDLPPVLTANALGSLPPNFDITLLVIDAQRTRRRAARRALKVLQQSEARVAGVALNRAKIRE